VASKHMRILAAKLVARLPDLPRPWAVEALCEELQRVRGRPLTLHSADLPALPFGMWYDDGTRDYIVYRSSATGYYRDHIVLHEICHMLAGHGVPPPDLAGESGSATVALRGRRAKSKAFSNAEEELAETFAAMVLRMAGHRKPKGLSPVERRAEELFGVPCA